VIGCGWLWWSSILL